MPAGGVVQRVLSHAVPDRVPTRIERIEVGNRKRTWKVTFDGGPALAVQSVSNHRERLVTEGTLLREIADRTSVPVAPVVAHGVLGEGSYLLTEWVNGVSLGERFVDLDPPVRNAVARVLGRHLGALHAGFEFDAFGPVTATLAARAAATATAVTGTAASDGRLAVTTPVSDWGSDFRALVEEGLKAFYGPLADLEPSIREVIDGSVKSLPRAPVPRLFPWDYRPGNVLVRGGGDGRIAAVLDWESPRSAHREFSLAKTEYLLADWYAVEATSGDSESETGTTVGITEKMNSEAIRGAFYAGYEAHLPVSDGYWRERRRIYRLGAIVRAAFDSRGAVTRPGYPMVDADRAARFHREHLRALL